MAKPLLKTAVLLLLFSGCLSAEGGEPQKSRGDWMPPRRSFQAVPLLTQPHVGNGGPLFIGMPAELVADFHLDARVGSPVQLQVPDFGSATKLVFASAAGATVELPFRVTAPDAGRFTVKPKEGVRLRLLLSPEATASLSEGSYTVQVSVTAPPSEGGWSGRIESQKGTVQAKREELSTVTARRMHHFALFNYFEETDDLAAYLQEADAWVSEEPESYSAHAARGDALARLSRDDEALVALSRAADLYFALPTPPPGTPPDFLQLRSALQMKRVQGVDGGG